MRGLFVMAKRRMGKIAIWRCGAIWAAVRVIGRSYLNGHCTSVAKVPKSLACLASGCTWPFPSDGTPSAAENSSPSQWARKWSAL